MANSDEIVWVYEPNFPAAVFFSVLYTLVLIVITYQTVFQYRAWYFLTVVIGTLVDVGGYATRCYSIKNPTEIAPFVVTLCLVVLAPVFIAAGNYLLIGRLVRSVLPPTHHTVFGVPARWLTRIFVGLDILSFLVQSSGSANASAENWSGPNAYIGVNILLGGLCLQVAALSMYLCILGRFHVLTNRLEVPQAPLGWRNLLMAVYVSSSLIMIRSIYRVAEFAEGYMGYAFRNEWMFYVFEAVPIFIAIAAFCLCHPSKYLGRRGGKDKFATDVELTSNAE